MKAKKLIVLASVLAASFTGALHAKKAPFPEWNDIEVLSQNREAPRATMMVYPDTRAALKYDRTTSPYFKSLNGDWKFNWVRKPADRPVDFYKTDFDSSDWKTTPVPSNWQMQGYGLPIYLNRGNNFGSGMAPHVPTDWNPVGSYLSDFTVPKDWDGRDTYVVFDGVDSAFYLWVNGEKVGYSEGSRTAAEFNLGKYLKPGNNTIAVEVYRWSVGSYLEDQDMWRLSGIFRDVYLWSTPKSHVEDFQIVTDLDEEYKDATVIVKADVKNPKGTFKVSLMELDGTVLKTEKVKASELVEVKFDVENPKKWTPETPNLYMVSLALVEEGFFSDDVIEVIPQRIGFREVEIKDMVFLINGKPVLFRGANRHEHDPDNGHVISRENMIADIKLLKENNFNAVRTAHYPNVPMWYDLADEYGIMLWDEANLESHGMGYGANSLAKNPRWQDMHLERVGRMFERDKNHASVVTWSLGNEAGDGVNIKAAYDWMKKTDPTRPVHYERSEKNVNTDIISHMYFHPNQVKKVSFKDKATKPLIVCEYMHSMGNSTGGPQAYWDLFYSDDYYTQGGFVWDWMDQGIRQKTPEQYSKNIGLGPVSDEFFAYGGWFENKYNVKNFGNFCFNGIVTADRELRPGANAMKYQQRYAHVTPVDLKAGKFNIKNWFDFINLNQAVTGKWTIEANGEQIAEGQISDLNLPARTDKEFTLNLPKLEAKAGVEYFINFEFVAVDGYHPMVEQGHLIAWDQFKLPVEKALPVVAAKGKVTIKQNAKEAVISGDNFKVTFNKKTGDISNYALNGKDVILNGGALILERAIVDNERGQTKNRDKYRTPRWETAGKNATVESFKVQPIQGGAKVTVQKQVGDVRAGAAAIYTVYATGEVVVEAAFNFQNTPKWVMFPHYLNMEWELPKEFQTMTWFGMEGETYIDRNFEFIGLNKGSIDEQWNDYSRPQENGNKTDVRWMTVTNDKGEGVLLRSMDKPLEASARNYSTDEMRKAEYSFEMNRSDRVHLNVVGAQEGVGGITSWGVKPLLQHRLMEKVYNYSYSIQPITGEVKEALASKVKFKPSSVRALAQPNAAKLPNIPDSENLAVLPVKKKKKKPAAH